MNTLFCNIGGGLCGRRVFGAIGFIAAIFLIIFDKNNQNINLLLTVSAGLLATTTADALKAERSDK
ncbi:MAG: hypothetical protein LBQ37_02390 [Elusimicrobiota bacterium]|jgi:hypothetical protein|nr:hypothetical protein [Elusimicrobiota bacterium]